MNHSVMSRPAGVVEMPWWPGAHRAIELAIAGAKEDPPMAVGLMCEDRSVIVLEYQLTRIAEIEQRWPSIYQNCGEPPLLSVLVIDNRLTGFDRDNDAQDHLREIQSHIDVTGKRPSAIVGASIDESRTRRRYWWRLS